MSVPGINDQKDFQEVEEVRALRIPAYRFPGDCTRLAFFCQVGSTGLLSVTGEVLRGTERGEQRTWEDGENSNVLLACWLVGAEEVTIGGGGGGGIAHQ